MNNLIYLLTTLWGILNSGITLFQKWESRLRQDKEYAQGLTASDRTRVYTQIWPQSLSYMQVSIYTHEFSLFMSLPSLPSLQPMLA